MGVPQMKKICKLCGKEFETSRPQQTVCKDTHYRKCVVCGKEFVLKYPPYTTKTCSKKCAFEYSRISGTMAAGREKSKQTCLERYGVEHPMQNSKLLLERTERFKQKYGVENPNQVPEIQNRIKETNIAKYGVENVSKSEEVKNKIRQHFIDTYGVDNPMKIEEIQAKQQESTKRTTGYEFAQQSPTIQEKTKQTSREKYGSDYTISSNRTKSALHNYCKNLGVDYLTQSPEIMEKIRKTCLERYGVPYNCMRKECRTSYRTISKYNQAFVKHLSEIGLAAELEFNLGRYSYDFRIERTLIELDPSITHNSYMSIFNKESSGLDKNYHLEKSTLAKENGYRCIHVFDWDDWDKVIQLLTPSTTLYARNLEIREVGKVHCDEFEKLYHLQGTCKGQAVRLGLYQGEELVQIMTFGDPRYTRKYSWELLRLCTKPKYKVVGGAEKLFKYFIRNYNPESIISYCDLSKFSGDVYTRLGMILDHISPPAKNWSFKNKRITDNLLRSRGYDQIFKTSYGKGTSNEELMLQNSWLPVYDCGQAVFVWKK